MKHPVGAGLERQPHMDEPAGAVPAIDDQFCERQLLFQGTCIGKGRIGRRKRRVRRVAHLLGDQLPNAHVDHRLDHRSHGLGAVDVDHVIERTRRSGPDLLQRAEIGGDPYVLRGQLQHQRYRHLVEPRFEQKSLAGIFEQARPVMVVAVDQAGDHDHLVQVDGFVDAVTRPRRQVLHRTDAANAVALDANPAVADYVAIPIDGDDVTVFQEQRRHAARTPACCRDGPGSAALHGLTAVRIQILYSGARTFLEQYAGCR